MFAALVNQDAMRLGHIVIIHQWPVQIYNIFPQVLTNGAIIEKISYRRNVQTDVLIKEECILKNKNKSSPYKKLFVFYNSCLKTFVSHLVKCLF